MIEGLVSIITPMYNAQKTVAKTIESVQKQTYEKWEMIIVDDGSTDRSVEIVREYSSIEERILLIRNEKNVGVAESRNNAIKKAKGQYIAFLDSDDLWKCNKLEIQLKLMKDTNSSFCYGMCGVVNQNGEELHKERNVPERINYSQLLKGNVIPCLTVLIDRKQISSIVMPNVHHEDYACWLDLFRKYDITACGVQSVIAEYRVGSQTVSSSKLKSVFWTWDIYRKYLKLPLFKSIQCFVWYVARAISKRC